MSQADIIFIQREVVGDDREGVEGAGVCCWLVVILKFGYEKKKEKMTSGRLVSLPHLHEKQESEARAVALIHLCVLPPLPY